MLTNDSDRDWERLGQADPYYAVLTDERYRLGHLTTENRATFFHSGRDHVERIFTIIREHVDPAFNPISALDFGCGVGRVLIPLAARCRDMTGIDVSESMLAEARRNCAQAGAEHVKLVLGDDALRNIPDTYDLIHCYIVLQHVPVRRGEGIIRELATRLTPGGVGVFHVTYSHVLSPLARLLYWARTHIPGAHSALNVALGRSPSSPMMQGNNYSVTRLLDMLYMLGCGDVHVRFSDHQGNRGVVLFCRNTTMPVFD